MKKFIAIIFLAMVNMVYADLSNVATTFTNNTIFPLTFVSYRDNDANSPMEKVTIKPNATYSSHFQAQTNARYTIGGVPVIPTLTIKNALNGTITYDTKNNKLILTPGSVNNFINNVPWPVTIRQSFDQPSSQTNMTNFLFPKQSLPQLSNAITTTISSTLQIFDSSWLSKSSIQATYQININNNGAVIISNVQPAITVNTNTISSGSNDTSITAQPAISMSSSTITNMGNEIVGVQFYDQNKKPLPLINANINITNPGQLGGSDSMNIPTTAAFVTVGYTQGIPNTNKYKVLKELVSFFPINPTTSYFIVGIDLSAGGKTLIPWGIVDTIDDNYKILVNASIAASQFANQGHSCHDKNCANNIANSFNNDPAIQTYLQALHNAAVKNDTTSFNSLLMNTDKYNKESMMQSIAKTDHLTIQNLQSILNQNINIKEQSE